MDDFGPEGTPPGKRGWIFRRRCDTMKKSGPGGLGREKPAGNEKIAGGILEERT